MAEGKKAGQGGPQLEDKGKGKEAKTLLEAKGKEAALKTKDADPKTKHAAAKAKDAAAKAKDANPKMTLLAPRLSFRNFPFLFCTFFVVAVSHCL